MTSERALDGRGAGPALHDDPERLRRMRSGSGAQSAWNIRPSRSRGSRHCEDAGERADGEERGETPRAPLHPSALEREPLLRVSLRVLSCRIDIPSFSSDRAAVGVLLGAR